MTQPVPLFSGEAMLLSWGDTSSRGKTVTFALHEDDCGESHPFRDLGTGKHGQRFQIVAVPITDEGEPVPPEAKAAQGSVAKADPPSAASGGTKRERTLPEKVGMRCNDKRFQEWALRHASEWSGAEARLDRGDSAPEVTAAIVRKWCGVKSRSHIQPGTEAAQAWVTLETRFLADTGQIAEEIRR